MCITINSRVVLIVGPTTSGKTTLAKRIKEEFPGKAIIISHDDIAMNLNKNNSKEQSDFEHRMKMISSIQSALDDEENQLIILDTLNIRREGVFAILMLIKLLGVDEEITLLKTNISLETHCSFFKNRNDSLLKMVSMNELLKTILEQRAFYEGESGSLNMHYQSTEEIVISNPEDVTFSFELPHKLK